ncbi:MAG: 30S ribosomal protein S21 [Candidatus Omnitrophica bacterium]|nr:30S ribosomal protein S21 [Candidatus Omnitrophota bacterium]
MKRRSRPGEDFEKIFKRFKREVEREKILQEIKGREFFEPASRQRRLKRIRKTKTRP